MTPHDDPPATRRRPAIDVARVLALAVVVIGHLSLAVIDRGADGSLRGTNLLEIRPGWAWVAVLSPMAVFFTAAGWANLTSDPRSAAPRLRTLVGLGAVVVSTWVAVVGVAWLVTGDGGVVADGARIATQPLWFLAAYVPLVALSPQLAMAARHPVLAVGTGLALLAVLDAARFARGAPGWIGWPGFAAAWATPWILGAWWRLRVEAGPFAERRVGALLAIGGAGAGWLLVRHGGYSPALIDAVQGQRSNTTPPTLFTATAAICWVGLMMMSATLLDRAGVRWARQWRRAGVLAVPVYVLHLTALALCAGAIAAGLPVPTRLTGWWWATRPVWWVVVLGVTGLLVAATAAVMSRGGRATASRPTRVADRPAPGPAALWAGIVLATIGGAAVGLKGPRTFVMALVCVGAFCGSWWFLARGDAEHGSDASVAR